MKLYMLNRGDLFSFENRDYKYLGSDGLYGKVICTSDSDYNVQMCNNYDLGSYFFCLHLLIDVIKYE